MKILTAIGARPQFIKAAPISEALKKAGAQEIVVHSGQHYDHGMSQVFFDELEMSSPDINLGVGSGSHGKQTGEMLSGFENAMIDHRPDWVIVHGDTNSTIAAALAAVKLQIKVAHNEAGLRSFNREMPEEHNRVLTDHCADVLFCPTQTAVDQLAKEGIGDNVHMVGDVMLDASLRFSEISAVKSGILTAQDLSAEEYSLATLHRPYNVDVKERLEAIFAAFAESKEKIVLPCHPRLAGQMKKHGMSAPDTVVLIDPVGYLDMVMLEKNARMIITDSGGVQKEAYFYSVPCITARPETEWVETVRAGWNRLVGSKEEIVEAMSTRWWPEEHIDLFGDGRAAERIVQILDES